ncbi:MAG: cation:dicarboxylase symporter family transporter [Methanotrichaceae archaeon]|nr:cation:dicarboxylase symporter family transporter [Methanotrichaceae archaeon]
MKLSNLGMTTWMLLGFVFGVLFGLFFGDLLLALMPLSQAFIKIWQITILPSVVLSLILGIGSLNHSNARDLAFKACLVLLMFWAIGVAIFFSFQIAFPVLERASFFSTQDLIRPDDLNIIDLFIPYNPFRSLSEGFLPAIVVFCVCLGFALMGNEESKPLMNLLNILQAALTRITGFLSRTFPIGVFVITAQTMGTITLEGLLELQVFLISTAILAVLVIFVVLPLLISCMTTFRYRDIISASSRAIILGFSTGTEFITLPLITDGVNKLFTNSLDNGENKNEIVTYSKVLVPVGYAFPLLGAFFPFLFILFVAWLYQNPLDLPEQLKLIAVGIPSFFGSSKVSVEMLLNLMHLPADSFNLYISSGILRQSFVASMASMSIYSFTTITVALMAGRCKLQWKKAIFSILLIIFILVVLLSGLKFGFAHLLANTYHGSDLISNIELPRDAQGMRSDELVSTKVHLAWNDSLSAASDDRSQGDVVRLIKHRGVLRVGYNSNCIPFVFFNKNGSLVGYDVQMAYELAQFINVSKIEFVPITGDLIADFLNRGVCDIVMSSVTVTPERLDEVKFTDSYMTVHMAFVVRDERKKKFLMLDNVRKMDNLRIAVLNKTAFVAIASELFPKAKIIKLNSIWDFFDGNKADALFTTAEEGKTMTLMYPFYDVAIFEPNDSYKVLYAYPVAKNSSETFLMLLNYWIKMERDYGELDRKYNYWILGKTVEKKESRWSVVRNVLHWAS